MPSSKKRSRGGGEGDRKYRSALGSFVESLEGSDEDRIKEVIRARAVPRVWIYYLYRKSRDRAARGRYSWLEFAIGSREYYSIHEFLKMFATRKWTSRRKTLLPELANRLYPNTFVLEIYITIQFAMESMEQDEIKCISIVSLCRVLRI